MSPDTARAGTSIPLRATADLRTARRLREVDVATIFQCSSVWERVVTEREEETGSEHNRGEEGRGGEEVEEQEATEKTASHDERNGATEQKKLLTIPPLFRVSEQGATSYVRRPTNLS